MAFQELTLTDGCDEVMVDLDTETGKIIGLYTYENQHLEYYSEKKDDYFPIIDSSWKPNNNPLFVHCPSSKVATTIKRLGETELKFDEDEEELLNLIIKMKLRYKLPSYAFGV